VIACSLPPLIEINVSYDDGLELIINDDYQYDDVNYFTIMIVCLNVLDSGCKPLFMYNQYG
jgi:hypothetical protein